MKFSDITDKLRQYPTAAICTVLLLVFVAVIILRGDVASELAIQESELNSRIRTINENIKNSKMLDHDTAQLNAMVKEINGLVFNRYERAININFFYGLEDNAGVVISSISQLTQPDPVYAAGGARDLHLHSTLVYNINLSGSFTNILSFLYEISRAEPLMRVADLRVSRRGDESGGASVDARMRVVVLAEKD